MKTFFIVLLALLAALVGGFFWLNNYIYQEKQAVVATDYKDAEFIIEGQRIKLEDGYAETEAAPGSSSKVITRYFGNEAQGDVNGDGTSDVVFLLTQDGGGSGTFYYAVAALQNAEGTYQGTNAIFLGDRIHPQTTNILDGQIIVNYGERKPGDPMTAEVTLGVSRYLKIENATLVEADLGIEWLIGESNAFAESGAPLVHVGLRAAGQQRGVGTFEGSCFVIEESEWELLPGERSGVICWFAGGGTEIGIFEENGGLVVKKGFVEEGTAEGGGGRSGFETLFAL